MRHQSRFVAMLCLGFSFGLCAAFNAPSAYSQGNSAIDASQVAFTTPNLLNNGDFDLGTNEWTTTGAGLKWKVEKDQALFALSPIPGAPASQLSLSQLTKKPVRSGKTLALRFQAQGRGHLAIVIYETEGDKRTLLTRRFNVTQVSEPQTFTVAIKTSNYYYPGQIGLKFHLGFDPTVLGLSHIRLVDLGDTPFDGLSITPDETKLPELMPSKKVEPLQSSALIQTPKVEVPYVRPAEPLNSFTGTNILKNGDFSEQDKYWRAWGDRRVDAKLDGKFLKLKLSPIAGEDPWTAGFEQIIDRPLTKGTKLTVRFKASGNAKFAFRVQEDQEPYASMIAKEETATSGEKEYVYQGEVNRNYAANGARMSFFLNYTAGDVNIGDIQILIPKN